MGRIQLQDSREAKLNKSRELRMVSVSKIWVFQLLMRAEVHFCKIEILSGFCSHNYGNPSFEILDELLPSPSATSSSSPWFNDELMIRNLLP